MKLIGLVIGQMLGFFVLFASCLFLPAGVTAWPAGWTFLILFFAFFLAVNLWLFKHNPALLEERLNLHTPDQKGWDKMLFPAFLVFTFVWLVFISFDATRFHWSPVPVWLQALGAAILLGSFYLLFLTFRENSYLSPVVRLQQERGHQVVSSGPYHYLRHPMYAGILFFVVGTPLLLGSAYGVVLGLLSMIALARRAVLEESMLRQELEGYAAYMQRVKYRFIPFIW